MSYKQLLPLFISICFTAFVQAETFKGGYAACLSEDFFDQLTRAAINKDQNAINYLSENGCVGTKAGIPITVLDRSWDGKAKVRAYIGGKTYILWTVSENIQN